jgi:hypothetical protein
MVSMDDDQLDSLGDIVVELWRGVKGKTIRIRRITTHPEVGVALEISKKYVSALLNELPDTVLIINCRLGGCKTSDVLLTASSMSLTHTRSTESRRVPHTMKGLLFERTDDSPWRRFTFHVSAYRYLTGR